MQRFPLQQRSARRRGFNLIEAAIVLAVVGLVIGGIWVAMASVMENMRVQQTVSGIMTMRNNVDRLIPASQASAAGSTIITCTLSLYPGDWPCPPLVSGNGADATTPLGHLAYSYVSSNYLRVGISNYTSGISKSVCIKLINGFFETVGPNDTKLVILVGFSPLRKSTATVSAIKTLCESGGAFGFTVMLNVDGRRN